MKTVLTADLVARAIVVSARTFGDDPVAALTAKPRRGDLTRRAIAPAGIVLCEVSGWTHARMNRLLGLAQGTLGEAWRRQGAEAAIKAVRAELAPPAPKAPGTDLAPPPVGPEPAAARREPEPPPERVDHTPAIREALRRRKAVPFTVVGVEKDRALLPEPGVGGCSWPMGDPRSPDYHACAAPALSGRMYCADHLKAAGLKPEPKAIVVAGRVAAPYEGDAA